MKNRLRDIDFELALIAWRETLQAAAERDAYRDVVIAECDAELISLGMQLSRFAVYNAKPLPWQNTRASPRRFEIK